jgi:hypothetical protein
MIACNQTSRRRKGKMIPTRHEPDQTSLGGAGPAVVVAGSPVRPVCRFRHPPGPAIYQFGERQTGFVFRRFNMQPKKHRLAAGGCGGELV